MTVGPSEVITALLIIFLSQKQMITVGKGATHTINNSLRNEFSLSRQ